MMSNHEVIELMKFICTSNTFLYANITPYSYFASKMLVIKVTTTLHF